MGENIAGNVPEAGGYGEILYDRKQLFHGIGFDMTRFVGVLRHGILSVNAAKERSLSVPVNTVRGYNTDDLVSVAVSPSINNTFGQDAFDAYIASGLSFVINPADPGPLGVRPYSPREMADDVGVFRRNRFRDEAFVEWGVPPENISGVMVPKNSLDTPLGKLRLGLSDIGWDLVDDRVRQTLTALGNQTGYNAPSDRLEDLIVQKAAIDNGRPFSLRRQSQTLAIINKMDLELTRHISAGFSAKLGKGRVTVRDMIRHFVPSGLPIYGSTGAPMTI